MFRSVVLSSAALAAAAGQSALASGGVGFLGAHSAAVDAFPSDIVIEIDREGGVFEVESFAQTFLREIEVSATSGAVLDVDSGSLNSHTAAVAAAYTADALSWPDAIALAQAGPAGFHLDLLELEFANGGRLVFEAYYVGDSGADAGSIEFDAFTGAIVDTDFDTTPGEPGDPDNPNIGPVDLLAAIAAAEAFTGLPAIGVELELDGADRDYEVLIADDASQTVLEVEVEAPTGLIDNIEPADDWSWSEVASILALKPNATLDFADAIATAEAATNGQALEVEYDIEDGGRLVFDVELITQTGVIAIDVDAITGEVVAEADADDDDQPGTGVVAIGVLDAMNAAEADNPGFTAFDAELEFSDGAFEWEVELVSSVGDATVEADINAASGAVVESEPSDENAAQAASKLASATVSRQDATDAALDSVGGGFVYDLELDRESGRVVWEVGVLFDDRRWEVELDAASAAILDLSDQGPAHIQLDVAADGAPLAIGLRSLTPGDANDDDLVNGNDLITVINAFGLADTAADLTFDGLVNGADLLTVINAFGADYRD